MKLFDYLGIDKSAAIEKKAEGNRAARRTLELIKQNPNLIDRFDPMEFGLDLGNTPETSKFPDLRMTFYRPLPPSYFGNIFHGKSLFDLKEKHGLETWNRIKDKFNEGAEARKRLYDPTYKRLYKYDPHKPYEYKNPQNVGNIRNSYYHNYDETKKTLDEILAQSPEFRVRPGIEINVNDLPHDPYKFEWKGSGYPKPFVGTDLFVSGAAPVSAGYDKSQGKTFLARIKPHHLEKGLPTGAPPTLDQPFYTHHAMKVDPERRLSELREAADRLHDRKPVFDPQYPGGRNLVWKYYKNYETVVDFKKPVKPRFLVEDGIARPVKFSPRQPTAVETKILEDLRPGNPQGFRPFTAEVTRNYKSQNDALKKSIAEQYGVDLSKPAVPFKGGNPSWWKAEEAVTKPTSFFRSTLNNLGDLAGKARQTLPGILKRIRI
jgi:hypothetical protein